MPSFAATAESSDLIVVSWNLLDQNVEVDSVTITQSPADGPKPVQTITIGASQGTIPFSGLQANTPYTYTLHEVFTDEFGNTVTADFSTPPTRTKPSSPPPPPPPRNVGIPVNVKAVDVSAGSSLKVHLSWNTGHGQLPTASFEVQRVRLPSDPSSPPERDFPNLPATLNSLDDPSFDASLEVRSYIYIVIARDSARTSSASALSNAVTVFPAPAPPPLSPPSQTRWRWCHKCQGMFFGGNPSQGVCPADGQPHDPSQSGRYAALVGEDARGQQGGWRWCHKCQGMFFGGGSGKGVCPADKQAHDPGQSGHYAFLAGASEPLAPPVSVKAVWSGAGQVLVTWAPEDSDSSMLFSVSHRVGISPLEEAGASPWVVIASNLSGASFTDTRPHLSAGLRHIYKVCAFDKNSPSNLACSAPVGAPL